MAPWQSLHNKQTSLRPGPREPAAVELVQTNLRHLVVNRVPVVVQGRGLQDDPRGPHHHGHREDPEEQPVQHHRHVLPVLQDLKRKRKRLNTPLPQIHHLHCPLSFLFMFCDEQNSVKGFQNFWTVLRVFFGLKNSDY